MAKTSKISYKTYYNARLKEVSFHDRTTLPLYIQVTYRGNNTQFRSYYFDLFSKARYSLSIGFDVYGPKLEDIEKLEIELIEFIIAKLGSNFSLVVMKEYYEIYGRDLCDVMEPAFRDYLYQFMWDEGMQDLGITIREGGKYRFLYSVVRDMKKALKKELHDKLIKNALDHAPPYLALFGFMDTVKKWPMLSLSIKDWESNNTKDQFTTYVKSHFQLEDIDGIIQEVELCVTAIKKGKI